MASALGMIGAAAVGGGIGAGGGLGEAALQHYWSQGAAHTQRKWAEQMSSTAYQRAVADMSKAGINPIMAYAQGGASNQAVQQAQVPNVDLDIMGGAQRGMSLAREASVFKDTVATVAAGRKEAESRAASAKAFADVAGDQARANVFATNYAAARDEASSAAAWATRDATTANAALTRLRTQLEGYDVPAARAASQFDATEFGQSLRQASRILEILPVVGNFLKSVKPNIGRE